MQPRRPEPQTGRIVGERTTRLLPDQFRRCALGFRVRRSGIRRSGQVGEKEGRSSRHLLGFEEVDEVAGRFVHFGGGDFGGFAIERGRGRGRQVIAKPGFNALAHPL